MDEKKNWLGRGDEEREIARLRKERRPHWRLGLVGGLVLVVAAVVAYPILSYHGRVTPKLKAAEAAFAGRWVKQHFIVLSHCPTTHQPERCVVRGQLRRLDASVALPLRPADCTRRWLIASTGQPNEAANIAPNDRVCAAYGLSTDGHLRKIQLWVVVGPTPRLFISDVGLSNRQWMPGGALTNAG